MQTHTHTHSTQYRPQAHLKFPVAYCFDIGVVFSCVLFVFAMLIKSVDQKYAKWK